MMHMAVINMNMAVMNMAVVNMAVMNMAVMNMAVMNMAVMNMAVMIVATIDVIRPHDPAGSTLCPATSGEIVIMLRAHARTHIAHTQTNTTHTHSLSLSHSQNMQTDMPERTNRHARNAQTHGCVYELKPWPKRPQRSHAP